MLRKRFDDLWNRLIAVDYSDEEENRLGRLFNTLVIMSIGIAITIGTIFGLMIAKGIDPLQISFLLTAILASIVLSMICIYQVKRGHVGSMISFYISTSSISIGVIIFLFEGVEGPAGWYLFSWVISVSGVLRNPRYFLKKSALVLVYFLGLLIATHTGIYVPPFNLSYTAREFFNTPVALTMLISTVVVISYLNTDSLKKALQYVVDLRKSEEDQSKLQQQLLQSQKMEAIGLLAGGVAHDMNNILGVIMSVTSMLKTAMKPNNPYHEDINDILAACDRGQGLTRNLLGFARKGKYVKEKIYLNDVVTDSHKILKHTFHKKIHIETKLAERLSIIEGDRSQLIQALTNLCLNAADAMHGGGTLTIATQNWDIKDLVIAKSIDLKPGQYIQLQVTDTGDGMDPRTLQHVFEPFFTTKSYGEGTGLGLPMVYGMAKNHGGTVLIESEPGTGTSVSLVLPAVEPFSQTFAKTKRREPESQPGIGGILLVDDEELIRRSCQRLLTSLGYTVYLANNGRDAIDIYKEISQYTSLIILDMIMPIMDGKETFLEIRKINPKEKILISSGYGKDENVEELLASGAVGFLQKPFDLERLSQAVAQATNQQQSRNVQTQPFNIE